MGQGKYGKVYMAKHKYTNFICALKAVSKQKIK
jgi:serine/threonine protein kinase